MFERYSERARRAIFFARYSANQFNAAAIEDAHLLLGVLREDVKAWLIRQTSRPSHLNCETREVS